MNDREDKQNRVKKSFFELEKMKLLKYLLIMRKLMSNGQKPKSSSKTTEENHSNSPNLLYSFNHRQMTQNHSPKPLPDQRYQQDSLSERYSNLNEYIVGPRRKSISGNQILEPFLTNIHKRKKSRINSNNPHESRAIYNIYPEVNDNDHQQSFSRISEHYKQIQYILQEENTNLKQHNEYLIRVIGKLQQKQRSSQYKMQQYKHRIFELEKDRELYEVQRKQLEAHIQRIQTLMEKDDEKRNFDPNQLTTILSADQMEYDLSPHHQHNNAQTIDNLNDQCEALLYEYKKTGNSELRKECIKKLKQIRMKKIKRNNSVKEYQRNYQEYNN